MARFSIYEPFSSTVTEQLKIRRAILSTNVGVGKKENETDENVPYINNLY